jgi:myo-inositol-1(or 4)-monophosphatase
MIAVPIRTLETIAFQAGQIIKDARKNGTGWVSEKARNDFVTETDKACEALIKEELAHLFPAIPMLAEEGSGSSSGQEEAFFCVDPLDGTNNFVHGVPIFCVSIGLVENGRPTRGVVYDPVHDELYSAIEGSGATLNGKPIATSGRKKLEGAFVATGFPFVQMTRLDLYMEGFRRIVATAGGVRRCGSAALDLCWTAAGRFDGFWEFGLKPWDMAAGAVILQEAGGAVGDPEGGEEFLFGGDIVAGAADELYQELRLLVRPRK